MPLASEQPTPLTYEDYRNWPDGERWELIRGEAWDMTPVPSFRHQRVAVRLAYLLESALAGSPCKPCVAPADVILSECDVVQPDVFVVCGGEKVHPEGIRGAPDVVFEILSPSTALKDRGVKRALYERHGVAEYVLLDPEGEYAEKWSLSDERTYGQSQVLGPRDNLVLSALGGLSLILAEVFELPHQETLPSPQPPPV